ncbi:MAG: NAD(P)-dependent oxidoreductase [Rhodospirillaceae bacterium]
MKHVLVTEPFHDAGLALLRARDDVTFVEAPDAEPKTLAQLMPGVHGVAVRIAKLPGELLALSNDLEVVSRHGVGCDTVDVAHLTARGIPVAIANGANSTSVAEHTLGMMLALARRSYAADRAVRGGDFAARNRIIAADLEDAHLLIVGFGRVGRKLAPRARAFGMRVTVADIALDRPLADSLGCAAVEDFHDALHDADFVSLHIPLDDTTRNIVAAAELAAMKPGAIVINCARGGIVDEAALLAALEAGHLNGAGIDVFSIEPPPVDHPILGRLMERDDVLLAPHAGAASFGAVRAMSTMAVQNILDAFDGRLDPANVFNADGLGLS